MQIKNTELRILRAPLAKVKTAAVVLESKAGFKKKLKKAGGVGLAKEPGYQAKRIIYTTLALGSRPVGEDAIRLTCRKILLLAGKMKLKSIALPALGCAEGGFPLVGCAKIMTQEALKYLREHKTSLSQIVFCLPDKKSFRQFEKTVHGYVEHILHKFSEGPFVTVDAIIELKSGVILIERSNPPYGLALPGGFVDYGESLEAAVCREAKEETNMTLTGLRQFHTYSKPDRDPRFHTIGTVFVAKGKGRPQFGDDAKGLCIVAYKDLLKVNYAFDHKEVIRNYLEAKKKGLLQRRF